MKILHLLLILSLSSSIIAADKELKNPVLMNEYDSKIGQLDFGEHMLINILLGGLSGGIFGAGVGLSFYDTNNWTDSKQKLIISGASIALAGAVAGGVISYFEYKKHEPFSIGKRVINHTWYGGVGGAIVGAIVGLVPYSSSDNTDDILNYTGYGVAGGLLVGWALLFIDMPSNDVAMNFDFNLKSKQYQFSFTSILAKR